MLKTKTTDTDFLTVLPNDVLIRLQSGAFRSLCEHLQKRSDEVQNIDLMGLSGFCRNCLAKVSYQPCDAFNYVSAPDNNWHTLFIVKVARHSSKDHFRRSKTQWFIIVLLWPNIFCRENIRWIWLWRGGACRIRLRLSRVEATISEEGNRRANVGESYLFHISYRFVWTYEYGLTDIFMS